MLSKLLIVAIFVSGCGNNVKLKENKLENVAPLTDEQIASYQKSGVLIKSAQPQMQYQGRQLKISVYSSKETQDFLAGIPSGSQVPVYFTGGTDNNQAVIETIKRR